MSYKISSHESREGWMEVKRKRENLFKHGISSIFTIDIQESLTLDYLQILHLYVTIV